MNTCILIEDREPRLKEFMAQKGLKNTSYKHLEIVSGVKYPKLQLKISQSDFTPLEPYNILMIHRSCLSPDGRNALIQYVRERNKTLVLFSGGISSTILQNLAPLSYLLTINAANFYSDNLMTFLDNEASNVYELAYGKLWDINLLTLLLDKLSFYILEYNEEKRFGMIENILGLNDYEKKYFSDLEVCTEGIPKAALIKVQSHLSAVISEKF